MVQMPMLKQNEKSSIWAMIYRRVNSLFKSAENTVGSFLSGIGKDITNFESNASKWLDDAGKAIEQIATSEYNQACSGLKTVESGLDSFYNKESEMQKQGQ